MKAWAGLIRIAFIAMSSIKYSAYSERKEALHLLISILVTRDVVDTAGTREVGARVLLTIRRGERLRVSNDTLIIKNLP